MQILWVGGKCWTFRREGHINKYRIYLVLSALLCQQRPHFSTQRKLKGKCSTVLPRLNIHNPVLRFVFRKFQPYRHHKDYKTSRRGCILSSSKWFASWNISAWYEPKPILKTTCLAPQQEEERHPLFITFLHGAILPTAIRSCTQCNFSFKNNLFRVYILPWHIWGGYKNFDIDNTFFHVITSAS